MPLLLSDPETVAKSPPPQTQFTISVIFVVVFIVIIFSRIFTAIVRVAIHLRDSVFWLANYCRFYFDSISLGLFVFFFSFEVSVCHMLDFLFLPFFRKFTQEIYTRARKTNTNKHTEYARRQRRSRSRDSDSFAIRSYACARQT